MHGMDRLIDYATRTTTRRAFTIGSVAAGAALVLPRSGLVVAKQDTGLASANLPALDITVLADGYEGVPATTAAGRYLVNVTLGEGVDEAGVGFVQPPAGMSAAEFLAAVGIGQGAAGPEASPSADGEGEGEEGEEGPLPTFVYQAKFAGGTLAGAGAPGSAVIDLTPGEWFAWGDDPSAPQMPVIFSVTGEFPADVAEPTSDVTVTLIEFAIMVEGDLVAGDHIVRIVNQGAQPHFLDLAKAPAGTTNDDLTALVEAEMSGTPVAGGLNFETDFQPVTYTPTQSIGTQTWHAIPLEAGTYAAFCWFPTAGTGAPHAVMGMHTVFEVSA
jgi:hypothetical protein